MTLHQVRNMVEADLEQVLAWRNHPDIRRYMYTQHEISLEEHGAWFASASKNPNKHLLIFEVDSAARGFINFNTQGQSGITDWGFYLAQNTPRGTGTALGHTALNYAFQVLKMHKVCGEALSYNLRSARFHQRMGFTLEGTLRDQHYDGEFYHAVLRFGLLASEWNHLEVI